MKVSNKKREQTAIGTKESLRAFEMIAGAMSQYQANGAPMVVKYLYDNNSFSNKLLVKYDNTEVSLDKFTVMKSASSIEKIIAKHGLVNYDNIDRNMIMFRIIEITMNALISYSGNKKIDIYFRKEEEGTERLRFFIQDFKRCKNIAFNSFSIYNDRSEDTITCVHNYLSRIEDFLYELS